MPKEVVVLPLLVEHLLLRGHLSAQALGVGDDLPGQVRGAARQDLNAAHSALQLLSGFPLMQGLERNCLKVSLACHGVVVVKISGDVDPGAARLADVGLAGCADKVQFAGQDLLLAALAVLPPAASEQDRPSRQLRDPAQRLPAVGADRSRGDAFPQRTVGPHRLVPVLLVGAVHLLRVDVEARPRHHAGLPQTGCPRQRLPRCLGWPA
mmetsp:Transcript_59208/g.185805  ORF Transcript_59208/g.185805 Transcript_59208/m.185805 type:complete len:209 (-) Transcript_59208:2-628(-)